MSDYLLDTHSFLWTMFNSKNLGSQARSIILDVDNVIYISSITFWEISLKFSTGKLDLENCTPEQLVSIAEQLNFKTLLLSPDESATFYRLPKLEHKDPFDRMLIWQAISNNLILISKDSKFESYREYGLKTVW
jgi:PIN domain nuclease of toxin-antitoxin system